MAQTTLNNGSTLGVIRNAINNMFTEVYSLISGKADTTTVNSALAAKADSSALTSGLATKADSSDLTSGLATKADATSTSSSITALNTAVSTKISFPVSWNAATNVVTGVSGLTALTTSSPGVQTTFQNTAPGTTTVNYLGGTITSVNQNDQVGWNGNTGQWVLIPYASTLASAPDYATAPLASANSSIAALATTVGNNSSSIASLNTSVGTNSTAITNINNALNVLNNNSQSGTTYQFALSDVGQNVDMTNASANTLTIPANATVPIPVGSWVYWTQAGAGVTSVAAASGVTFEKASSDSLAISAQYKTGAAWQRAANIWRIYCQ